MERSGNISYEDCWDSSEWDNSLSWQSKRQAENLGGYSKADRIKTWEDYWLKRGISAASLAAWRLSDYSWDLELLPEDVKRMCETELLTY